MPNPLVPSEIRALAGQTGVAAFDADGVLWHGDIGEDFALWMIGEGHCDGALWPVYQRINAEDPAAAALQLLRFFEGHDVRRLRIHVERFWQVSPARRWLMRVRATISWARDQGLKVLVVSASPAPVLEPLKRHLAVDHVFGLELETDGRGRATGKAAGTPTVGNGKAERLRAHTGDPVVLAVGNSVLDIPMLELSTGVAWAINPDSALRAMADCYQWLVTAEPEE